MNPKYYRIRTDRKTGEFFLTHEAPRHPMKRLANVTEEILLCLVADLTIDPNTKASIREIKFDDGSVIKVTVEDMGIPDSEDTVQQAA